MQALFFWLSTHHVLRPMVGQVMPCAAVWRNPGMQHMTCHRLSACAARSASLPIACDTYWLQRVFIVCHLLLYSFSLRGAK
jgi:hypothetical protein